MLCLLFLCVFASVSCLQIITPTENQTLLFGSTVDVVVDIGPTPLYNFSVTFDGEIIYSPTGSEEVSGIITCFAAARNYGNRVIQAQGVIGYRTVVQRTTVLVVPDSDFAPSNQSIGSLSEVNVYNIWDSPYTFDQGNYGQTQLLGAWNEYSYLKEIDPGVRIKKRKRRHWY